MISVYTLNSLWRIYFLNTNVNAFSSNQTIERMVIMSAWLSKLFEFIPRIIINLFI